MRVIAANDPNSETRPAGCVGCNRSAMAGTLLQRMVRHRIHWPTRLRTWSINDSLIWSCFSRGRSIIKSPLRLFFSPNGLPLLVSSAVARSAPPGSHSGITVSPSILWPLIQPLLLRAVRTSRNAKFSVFVINKLGRGCLVTQAQATRPTRALDCNLDAMAGFAAAHG